MADDPRRRQTPGEAAPDAPEDKGAEWGGKAVEYLKGFGVRVFVHIAALIAGGAAAAISLNISAGVCVYAGLVCIVARGIGPTPDWLVPAGFGVAQAAILAILGFPLPEAVFWGGAQAWIQRTLHKRLAMGSEWVALLLLLPVGIYLVSGMVSLKALLFSFCGALLAGRVVARMIYRIQHPVSAEELRRRSLPEPEKVTAYRASLAALDGKIPSLPRSVRPSVSSIAASAGNILDCMVKDPRDLEPGHRFLYRYLNAVHAMVDKHIRLARENAITPEIIDALAKSEDMLVRLDAAFAQEHARLLKNDATDFSADMTVLDTLLKMDGK